MQHGLWRLVATALILGAGAASAGTDLVSGAGPNPWTNLNFRNNPGQFQFVIMGDRNGSNLPGIFEKAVDQVNLLCPEFVMCVGDLVPGGAKDAAELTAQWKEFDGWARKFEAPFFYVPGNHDMLNGSVGETVWKERLGSPYYHFIYDDVLFLCLNTEEAGGGQITEAQAEYVRKALEEHANVRWTLLFMHRPLWMGKTNNGWESVETALGKRPYTVFAGHTHDYLMTGRNGHDYVMMSCSGGGTPGKSTITGELDHVLWVTMTESGPRIANLLLDGIKDKTLVTPEKRALFRPILREEVVHSSVAPLDGKKVTKANVTLTLNNPSDLPMNALGTVYDNGQLQAEPARIECTVPPHGEIKTPVVLRAPHALPARELQPVRTQWTLAYDLPESGRYEVPMTHRIVLDAPQVCESAGKKARTENWNACIEPGQLSATTEDWKGAGDASFRFQVTQDKSNIYLKVHVTDDVRMAQSDRQTADVDNMEICLDARPEGQRTYGETKGRPPYLVLDLFLSDKDKAGLVSDDIEEVFAPYKKAMPLGAEVAQKSFASYSAQVTPDGYTADITISNEVLDAMAGQPWKSVRVNVAVTDSDSPSDRPAVLWWRPEWNSPASAPATGVFTRKRGTRLASGETASVDADRGTESNASAPTLPKENEPSAAASPSPTPKPDLMGQNVRIKFIPDLPSEESAKTYRGAAWTNLNPFPHVDSKQLQTQAWAGIGDEFPVSKEGGPILFKVKLKSGDDNRIELEITTEKDTRQLSLMRDGKEEMNIGGIVYTFLYPSCYVAPTESKTKSDEVMILVTTPLPEDTPSGASSK